MADPRSVLLNEGLIFRIRFKCNAEHGIARYGIDEQDEVAGVGQAIANATVVCIDLSGNALRLTAAE